VCISYGIVWILSQYNLHQPCYKVKFEQKVQIRVVANLLRYYGALKVIVKIVGT